MKIEKMSEFLEFEASEIKNPENVDALICSKVDTLDVVYLIYKNGDVLRVWLDDDADSCWRGKLVSRSKGVVLSFIDDVL